MLDLGSLSEIAQIVGEVVGGIITIGGAYYNWVIKPNRAYRAHVDKSIKELEDAVKEVRKHFGEDIKNLQESLKKADEDEQKELNDMDDDFKTFKQDINERLTRIDNKNEKLLDLIIKYFTDKD